jgi:hypothetical protein
VLARTSTINIDVYRYGYGYGLTPLSTAAVVILLIYCGCVVLYGLYKMIHWRRGSGWASSAWGDVSELLKLALLSHQTAELSHTGEESAWVKNVRVAEESGGRLAMVIAGASAAPATEGIPRAGKKYL